MKSTKVVNIYPSMPITTVNPPIRSTVKRVTKSIEEIRACLMARAMVEEVLSNGKTVRLDISNYDKCLCNEGTECQCGCNCKWEVEVPTIDNKVEDNKTPWQIAYNNAIAGKDLASMTRKQRRAVEAAARAAADAAVAESEPEVVIGVGTIETKAETPEIVDTNEVPAEEKVEVVDESSDVNEDEVHTDDIEAITADAE